MSNSTSFIEAIMTRSIALSEYLIFVSNKRFLTIVSISSSSCFVISSSFLVGNISSPLISIIPILYKSSTAFLSFVSVTLGSLSKK